MEFDHSPQPCLLAVDCSKLLMLHLSFSVRPSLTETSAQKSQHIHHWKKKLKKISKKRIARGETARCMCVCVCRCIRIYRCGCACVYVYVLYTFLLYVYVFVSVFFFHKYISLQKCVRAPSHLLVDLQEVVHCTRQTTFGLILLPVLAVPQMQAKKKALEQMEKNRTQAA